MSNDHSALESLAIEIEVIWGSNSVGAESMPPVVIAQAGSSWRIHVSPALSKDAKQLVWAAADLPFGTASSLLDRVHSALEPLTGPLCREVTLSYDCARPVGLDAPGGIRLITADDADVAQLRIAPDWGAQQEWERLLGNGFPWAAATDGDQVLAVCETARWSVHGTEAGVWTLAGVRGRGLAASVVGAWATQCAKRVERLYYSTSADNLSSQRVAERLGLPPIGELWFLTPDRG
ncbi:GNAT family N-acetyltransferase [Mycobacterium sp. NPDC050441]|uniref:GNAT family N-acetyltransferase n=1 Tax=Mycobacterium sp. NPDC050441 TaxID=3155403 RepID=UPI0033DC9BD2